MVFPTSEREGMTLDQRIWPAWIAIGWTFAVSWFAIDAQKPPAALPVDAPSEVFAAGRAQKHVEDIARAPHPTGSAEAEHVRDCLAQRLKDLGLEPEIQSPRKADSPVRNVVARLKGQGHRTRKPSCSVPITIPLPTVPAQATMPRVSPWCSRPYEH